MVLGKNPLLVIVIVLSALSLLLVLGSVSYISELQSTIDNQGQKVSQASSVDADFKYKEWATSEITKYQDYSNQLKTNLDELDGEKNSLKKENVRLSELVAYWAHRADEAEGKLIQIEGNVRGLLDVAEKESSKPKTTIYDQNINWEFSDSKGNRYTWSMPIETYEAFIKAREPQDVLRLRNDFTGEVVTFRDHTKFVQNHFENVIDEIWSKSSSDYDFAYEVWYIVSQLTTYSSDIEEDPRWALETLSRGGGDCEDTAILIADMLKSSTHTKNWKIELVYFDDDNPQIPKRVNHVAVHIDDGTHDYILESTAKFSPYAWPDGVYGWFFKV